MIALILAERCTGCNACVDACPTLVLDATGTIPAIARIDDCQTCYMCELHCPHDAILVGADQHEAEYVSADMALAGHHLGRVRHDHGWDRPDEPGHLDDYRLLGPLLNAGAEIASRRYATPLDKG